MWSALFIIVGMAAVGCAVAAVCMSPQIPRSVFPRRNHCSLIAEFAGGCGDVSKAACVAFEPKWLDRGNACVPPRDGGDAPFARLAITGLRNTTLLPRRMRLLHIDPVEFARAKPTVFHQLADRCGRCDSTEKCARDLSDDSTAPFTEEWRGYCPNAAILSISTRCAATTTKAG